MLQTRKMQQIWYSIIFSLEKIQPRSDERIHSYKFVEELRKTLYTLLLRASASRSIPENEKVRAPPKDFPGDMISFKKETRYTRAWVGEDKFVHEERTQAVYKHLLIFHAMCGTAVIV